MSEKKRTQEILPWANDELEALLRGLISHGSEVAKIDFKAEIETGTHEQKAELLKDIIAIANTYDDNYEDHGFIIYGVKAKIITGITHTETDTDKFQNHIEQLLKSYISPMPPVYVLGFETTDGKKWGAIAIPPRNSKPYMFFKELNCPADKTRSRKKGEWFVRRGSTTDVGLPEDLAIITQKQMEITLEPLRESIRSLQARITKTEEQYNSALFKLVERALKSLPKTTRTKKDDDEEEISSDIGQALGMDLPSRLKQKLRTPKDALAEDLIAEAKALRGYLEGVDTGLPWTPQLSDAEVNKKIIVDLEERTKSFQISVATILLNDNEGLYTDALLRGIKVLAKTTETPTGVQHNRLGEALRYYPLGLVVYTAFVCGVAKNRGNVLRQILQIPLKHQRRGKASAITDIFYYWYDARALFNHAFAQRSCEPIPQRIRQVLNDRIGEMITEFSEPEYFYRGEFVLALTRIEESIRSGVQVDSRIPLPGLYLYMDEAHDVIKGFLTEGPDWFPKLYSHPLNEILDMFDRNVERAVNPECFATGLRGLKASETYQESLRKKGKK
jgi:hypothetical protein